ncbi:MAG: hypothetical protein ABSF33_06760 [Acidimicrobiales bacterium]|jgi:hypothetical protein
MDWLGRQRRSSKRDEAALVNEATAFLTGQFAAHVASTSAGLPTWARVNSLAHARPSVLVRDLELRRHVPERVGSWARTTFDILEELVELASGQKGRIEQLQRECLIPLELRLMAPSFDNILPSDVLILALTRLRAHPIALQYRAASPPES